MTTTWNPHASPELEVPQPGQGGSFSGLVQSALGGAATAVGAAEAAAAFATGERDPNRLTNIIFGARHPERRGRPLSARETRLVQEWLRIRSAVVLPALRTARTISSASAATPPVVAPTRRYTLPPDPAQLRPPPRTGIDAVPLFP